MENPGHKAGDTLYEVPSHYRAQSHSMDNLDMDWWRKPEWPEESPRAQGNHVSSRPREVRVHVVELGWNDPIS